MASCWNAEPAALESPFPFSRKGSLFLSVGFCFPDLWRKPFACVSFIYARGYAAGFQCGGVGAFHPVGSPVTVAIGVAVTVAVSIGAINRLVIGADAFMVPDGGGFVLYRGRADDAGHLGQGFALKLVKTGSLFFGRFAGGKGQYQADGDEGF